MQPLHIWFEDPFEDPRITPDEKKKFGEDGISRFEAQNTGGLYTTVLGGMTAAQAKLFGAITSVETAESQAEARTKVVDAIIEDFTKRNTKLNRIFVANEVNKLAVYEEFFPQGVQPFTNEVTKENVEQKIRHMVDAVANNLAVAGGQSVLDEYNRFETDYAEARNRQLGKFSETSTDRDSLHTDEAAWNDAFFAGLLTAAINNRNHPEKLSLFFDQSIIKHAHNANDDKGRITGTFTKGGVVQSGVRVHVVDGEIDNAKTNDNGIYKTQYLKVKKYGVEFIIDGEVAHTSEANVQEGKETVLNVNLP